ncbi:hypothetical protein MTsPCn9_12310 [Croceitalea sp. MTPC9]|uniref:DUF4129 domain-containing protein n=1 Tax=unclassified Croceitalea TaxID=2632280 RepID=UPI002B3698AD|nr:hypothetical protein MTsPCn6_31330 [Croceitalea sp. MTPC6]GMN16295.1 hypothetical protein MTsPCn9_12310 [Croceitalea sp. MTPC9]
MKLLLTLIISFSFGSLVFSQEVTTDTIVRIDSSSTLYDRYIDEELNKKYMGEDFNYDTKTGESQNLLSRFFRWIGIGLRDVFGINLSPEALKLLEYTIYFLMGGLVIYLLVRVLVNEKFNSIFTKKAKTIFDIDLAEQHIESLDLDALLNAALEDKNYRLAIRYHFLRILKRLSQKDIIEWHFDKTNSDYQNEIAPKQLQSGFKEVAYLYDYIWYGEQPIDEKKYDTARARFKALNNLIAN